MNLKVMLDEGARMPKRAHECDAGADLFTPSYAFVKPGQSTVIDTGVHIEIPDGYVGLIKAKSGLNVNFDLTCTGVIDAGYTGSIKVKLYNHGRMAHAFRVGEKVAQILIVPVACCGFELVDALDETERGDGGFGSTGV